MRERHAEVTVPKGMNAVRGELGAEVGSEVRSGLKKGIGEAMEGERGSPSDVISVSGESSGKQKQPTNR